LLIDWHVHINDPKFIGKPWWPVPVPMTMEDALKAHALAGLDRTVISNAVHYIRHMESTKDVVAAIESSNRHLAKCRDLHPDKFVAMATCVPNGGDAFLKELERAIKQDDARAVIINSSHHGHYPDEDAAKPFFKLVTDLDIPVFIHPGDATTPAMKDYRLASSIGRPAENCLSLARLIVRGILEDFPRATIVASHGGGGICEVIGRMNYAYELQDECYFLGSYTPIKIKHEPGHYLKRMYFDTVSYHPPAAQLVVDTVGPDHVLYGSDAPPLTSLKPRAIKLVEGLRVSDEDREKIFWRNAAKLLKLDIPRV